MACVAQTFGDVRRCLPCKLQWDLSDPSPPECQRDAEGHHPKLSEAEIMALRICEQAWCNRCRGGYRARGLPKITAEVAANLVHLKLAFRSQFGSLKATTYGTIWLNHHKPNRKAISNVRR